MKRTYHLKPTELKREWVVVDASGQTLGRLASEIARVLRGKHRPSFSPHIECGDFVVVINADKVKLTGSKPSTKLYYHHTTYIGGIKACTAGDMLKKHPDRLITFAVSGMLPKTKLSRKVLKNLKVYAGSEHPHAGQKPVPMAARTAK